MTANTVQLQLFEAAQQPKLLEQQPCCGLAWHFFGPALRCGFA